MVITRKVLGQFEIFTFSAFFEPLLISFALDVSIKTVSQKFVKLSLQVGVVLVDFR